MLPMWNVSNFQNNTVGDGRKRRASQRIIEVKRLKVEHAGVGNAGVGCDGVGSVSNGLASAQKPKVQKRKFKKAIFKRCTTVSINVRIFFDLNCSGYLCLY